MSKMQIGNFKTGKVLINFRVVLFSLLMIFSSSSFLLGKDYVLKSPDKSYQVTVTVDDLGEIKYSVSYNDVEIVLPSSMGLILDDSLVLGNSACIYSPCYFQS